MTKTNLEKQKPSKTITTSLSSTTSINIHYQSRNSSSFKSIFQTWHNCSRFSPPPTLLAVPSAFDSSVRWSRIQPAIARTFDQWSIDACSWWHASLPFFDDVCRKIKWRHPTYYDFDESSSTKRGTNKKKRNVSNEPSFRTVESRSAIEDTEARSESQGNEGSWPVVVSSDREPFRDCGGGGEGKEIVKFRLEGLTQWELSFRNEILFAFSACLSTNCTKVSFFLFLSRVLYWCFDDGDGAREFRACASRLARGESFETKYFIEIFWWIRCCFKEKWNFIYGSR